MLSTDISFILLLALLVLYFLLRLPCYPQPLEGNLSLPMPIAVVLNDSAGFLQIEITEELVRPAALPTSLPVPASSASLGVCFPNATLENFSHKRDMKTSQFNLLMDYWLICTLIGPKGSTGVANITPLHA